MALRDLAIVLIRLYGLLLFFYCFQIGQQSLIYIRYPASSDAIYKVGLISSMASGVLDAIMGVCLLIFAKPIAHRIAPKTSDGFNIMVSPSDLALVSFSLAGIVFFVDGVVWLVRDAVAWGFSPKSVVTATLLDPRTTAGIAMSTAKVVVGLLLLLGSRGIVRAVRWVQVGGESEEKTKSESARQAITEPPNLPKCPNCGAGYNPAEYRQDVSEWLCSGCKKPLPKKNS
jgi:hypothetical protein